MNYKNITKYVVVHNLEGLQKALKCARGSYQRGILHGNQALSGADLRGRAKSYWGHYKFSRENLLSRMKQKGVKFSIERGKNNRLILVIGENSKFESCQLCLDFSRIS